MSFQVKCWKFSKRYNSTKRPADADATVYNCIIKDGSSIVNPKIELNIGTTQDPSQFNYFQIPNFDRYYYLREWTEDRGIWTAEMVCDVLATYKPEIGASNLYVLRAASEYDGRIVDNLYPCKTGSDFVSTAISSPYDITGCYVIGVVNTAGMYGSISYYAMTRASMARLLDGLMTDVVGSGVNPLNGFSVSDASLELQLSIVDPIQYIKSAVWLPVPVANITSDQTETNLKIFNWTIPGVTAYRVSNPSIILRTTINTTNHPDYASRGSYVNVSPYTLATLFFPPFGVIELDTSVMCNASSINADVYVDANTGDGNLVISCNNVIINKIDGKVGMPIQISQVARDYLGTLTNVAGNVAGAVSGFATGGAGGIASGIASSISAIGNAVSGIIPRSNTIGSGGNYSVLTAKAPELNYQFMRPVDDDLAQNGRPLCKKKLISSMSGYMLIQDGDVAIPGSRSEAEAVQALLQGGFYYE